MTSAVYSHLTAATDASMADAIDPALRRRPPESASGQADVDGSSTED
ncbi:MAG TPA: hypothetical protein VIS06_15685 [Mycobacteriales bacterium]